MTAHGLGRLRRPRAGLESRRRPARRSVGTQTRTSASARLAQAAGDRAGDVSAAASQSAISVACTGARPNATATSAVPSDWPIRRPEDCRPAAPPLRSRARCR